ncbi:MAG: hypothetical protein Kow0031_21470 [Anaerolineae bacterium]
MPDAKDVDAKINEVTETAGRVFKQEHAANYRALQELVTSLEGLAREAFQAKLDDMYWSILEKLEDGQPLTAAEHNILELLMVGEAKYYLRYENDVDNWRTEVKRLVEELKRQQAAGLDEIDSLMRLRALCREALRVLPDLAYYFREKERVRQFEDATRDAIDVETRRALANLIKDMMDSDEL